MLVLRPMNLPPISLISTHDRKEIGSAGRLGVVQKIDGEHHEAEASALEDRFTRAERSNPLRRAPGSGR